MPKTPTLKKDIQWRIEFGFYRVVEGAIGMLSGATVSELGRQLGAVAFRVMGKRRRMVIRNLRIAFGEEKTLSEIRDMALEVFCRSGANLLSSLRTAGLSQQELAGIVSIENPELLENMLKPDRGAVVLLAHMGNWEALAQVIPQLVPKGRRAGDIYRRLSNPYLDTFLKLRRERMGLVLFEKRTSPMTYASFVRGGDILAVVSDQRADSVGEVVSFFGKLTSCTPLPAMLARRIGVPVAGLSMKTVGPGRWSIRFHVLTGEPSTESCMKLLEEIIRESPEDVFWLQNRWRNNAIYPLQIFGRAPGDESMVNRWKKKRGLIVLPMIPENSPVFPEVQYDDLVWEYALPRDAIRPSWIPSSAPIHELPDRLRGQRDVQKFLIQVDECQKLPLDVFWHPKTNTDWHRAAKHLQMIVLSEEHPPTA